MGSTSEHTGNVSREKTLGLKDVTPMFFVSVASTRLRYCASPLDATHRRGLRSVASKRLTLHQNCGECAHFRSGEWALASPRSARKRCAKTVKKGVRGVERQEKK